ncbi:MAG: hypothetical protein CL760_10475 [Chloroflexi bacterium]|nr:hypothetical protein [Chloroflexota bacterium]|tara:strand:- start:29762 stop:29986 length:225 start_codon:yes stop_codon:yes gene_type:complete
MLKNKNKVTLSLILMLMISLSILAFVNSGAEDNLNTENVHVSKVEKVQPKVDHVIYIENKRDFERKRTERKGRF